jgi:UDP-3-O-[3-hydroxymyristoyl] glucosamine N-acyltransferase
MIDPRFYTSAGPFSLGQIADHLGVGLADSTPRDFMIASLATIDEATESELSMFAEGRYRAALAKTGAGAVIASANLVRESEQAATPHLIVVESARTAFADIVSLFYPRIEEALGTRDERSEASIADDAVVSASACIGRGAQIGSGSRIGANTVIGRNCVIGRACSIGPNATVSHAIIGDRVQIYPGAVVGTQGFGFVPAPTGLRRIGQLGRVIVGDDVEIGTNSCVDRGALGDTEIGRGTVIDNLVQIGHNVRIGRSCVLSGHTGLAGSVRVGDGVMIGGGCSINGHITIGDRAQISGNSGVMLDVAPGAVMAGYPAVPIRDWHRHTLGLARLFSRNR